MAGVVLRTIVARLVRFQDERPAATGLKEMDDLVEDLHGMPPLSW